ncbi:MAG: ketopantoate reductase family protein [Weeksellaceae bacterium]|nr:ketopantoate reductase family protein [Weeksellaceae bacterium]
MRFLVIGAGGVGGYLGGKLAQNGHDLHFYSRGEHGRAMKENGLRVSSVDGDFEVKDVQMLSTLNDLHGYDCIFLTTKADEVESLAMELKDALQQDTLVVPLQNGLTSEETLWRFLPYEQVLPGMCKIYSKVEAPGHISHFGWNKPMIHLGEDSGELSERLLQLVQVLNDCGFDAHAEEDIWLHKWIKFMYICSGGLTSVTQSSFGEVRSYRPSRKMLEALFTEIYHVGRGKMINWEADVVELAMKMVDNTMYEATSSMQRDIRDGKPSELEFLNGTVLKYAYELDIHVPVNEMIYRCLSVREHYARKE